MHPLLRACPALVLTALAQAADRTPVPVDALARGGQTGPAIRLPAQVEAAPASADPNLVARRLPREAWRVGLRLWTSNGDLTWATRTSLLADPSSQLEYDDLAAGSIEAFVQHRWRLRGGRNDLTLRATVGAGLVGDGELRDRDWTHGDLEFSDTLSNIDSGRLAYGWIEADFALLRRDRTRIGLFAGLFTWYESVHAEGIFSQGPARFSIDRNGLPTSATVNLPYDRAYGARVISNRAAWFATRIGASLEQQLNRSGHLELQAGLMPVTWLENEDTHHLRYDFGDPPITLVDGLGAGAFLDASLHQQIGPVELSLGARAWGMVLAASTADFEIPNRIPVVRLDDLARGNLWPFLARTELARFEQYRYGLVAGFGYRF